MKSESWVLQNEDVHKIGLTSIFIASKFEDRRPLSMNQIYSKIGHKQIPLAEIIEQEIAIMRRMNFSVSVVLSYDILTTLIENFNPVRMIEEEIVKEVRVKSLYLLKISLHHKMFIDM